VENPQFNQDNRPSTKEASHQEEGEDEEDLRRSRIMMQEIHTFNADIMGEVTAPKLA
jgi:hypothetical protein